MMSVELSGRRPATAVQIMLRWQMNWIFYRRSEAAEIRYVTIDDIIFCRSNNSYTTFYVIGIGKITVSKPINEYEPLLAPYGFLRTHQSFLVNKNRIVSYKKEDGGYLLMEGGEQALLSRQRKHLLRELFI